jgi:hypothetical protein
MISQINLQGINLQIKEVEIVNQKFYKKLLFI